MQYELWLYFFSNQIFEKYNNSGNKEDREIAIDIRDKCFMVNMAMTGRDIYYGHKMPGIFLPTHTQGVVFSPYAKNR